MSTSIFDSRAFCSFHHVVKIGLVERGLVDVVARSLGLLHSDKAVLFEGDSLVVGRIISGPCRRGSRCEDSLLLSAIP